MKRRRNESDGTGISAVSDLMAGLMLVFMLIAVLFMFQLQKEKERNETAVEQIKLFKNLFQEQEVRLQRELSSLGKRYDGYSGIRVETIGFAHSIYSPNILFATGSSEITSQFQVFLSSYCPEFVGLVVRNSNYVEEVRIEGHTDNTWLTEDDEAKRYLLNMNLSQARSATVLELCVIRSQDVPGLLNVRKIISASGRSFSTLVYSGDVVDLSKSRRVEFNIRTSTASRINALIDQLGLK